MLHHSRILFLESFVQPSRTLEVLVDTAQHTALLARTKRPGGEVVDTVIEAALDEFGVHLGMSVSVYGIVRTRTSTYAHEFLQLLSLHARGELALFRSVESRQLALYEQVETELRRQTYPSIVNVVDKQWFECCYDSSSAPTTARPPQSSAAAHVMSCDSHLIYSISHNLPLQEQGTEVALWLASETVQRLTESRAGQSTCVLILLSGTLPHSEMMR